jgi:hypothetical protein
MGVKEQYDGNTLFIQTAEINRAATELSLKKFSEIYLPE